MYTKVTYPQVTDLSIPWSRTYKPTSDQKLYATSPTWDLTSSKAADRTEYWENPNGSMTKDQVDIELYGVEGVITSEKVVTISTESILDFIGISCDKLEISLINKNTITRSVFLLRYSDEYRLETIKVPTTDIVTIEIPIPFVNYKLSVPENFELTYHPYKVN